MVMVMVMVVMMMIAVLLSNISNILCKRKFRAFKNDESRWTTEWPNIDPQRIQQRSLSTVIWSQTFLNCIVASTVVEMYLSLHVREIVRGFHMSLLTLEMTFGCWYEWMMVMMIMTTTTMVVVMVIVMIMGIGDDDHDIEDI